LQCILLHFFRYPKNYYVLDFPIKFLNLVALKAIASIPELHHFHGAPVPDAAPTKRFKISKS
jgi:hypothetical protein